MLTVTYNDPKYSVLITSWVTASEYSVVRRTELDRRYYSKLLILLDFWPFSGLALVNSCLG